MGFQFEEELAIRYRGFVILPQTKNRWLVRPERSPMSLLPFRTCKCSLSEVKALVDLRINQNSGESQAA